MSLVTLAGSDDDRAELIPGLASGETVATVALNEAEVRATGERRLTGKETHVPDAFAADIILVSATGSDGERGVFVVDRDGTGVTVTPTPTVDGTRKFAALELVDAPARRLGAGDATDAVAETADRVVIAAVVDGVGAASRALEMAVDSAKERQQFDRPIGSFQAVQHLCADMLRTLELAAPAGTTPAGPQMVLTRPSATGPPPWRRRSRPTSSTAWALHSSRSSAASGSRGSTTRTCTTSGSSR